MGRHATVLIIHPDRVLAGRLARALAARSCDVLRTDSVAAGLARIAADSPDLIVFDTRLTGCGQLIQQVAEAGRIPALIAMTDSALVAQILNQSRIRTMEGPASLAEILIAVDEMLGLEAVRAAPEGRVLLVDDDPQVLDLLERLLARRGYAISSVAKGQEAVEVVTNADPPFAAVILDILLPDQDDLNALRRIVRHDPHPSVVVVSEMADSGVARQARDFGAFDYVLKPFDPAVVETSLSAAIGDFRYRTEGCEPR